MKFEAVREIDGDAVLLAGFTVGSPRPSGIPGMTCLPRVDVKVELDGREGRSDPSDHR